MFLDAIEAAGTRAAPRAFVFGSYFIAYGAEIFYCCCCGGGGFSSCHFFIAIAEWKKGQSAAAAGRRLPSSGKVGECSRQILINRRL